MTREPRRSVWPIVAGVLLPVLYFLSCGPAAYLLRTGRISQDVYDALYNRPLARPMAYLPDWADRAVDAYSSWWYNLGR